MTLPDYPDICPVSIAECRVELYEDSGGSFHYQMRRIGVKNQKANPTLCGKLVLDMRESAWFDIGDKRGKVHFDRACEECRERLVF